MRTISYAIMSAIVVTIMINIRMCYADELLITAPYMQTPTARVIDNMHYIRTLCDDIVLRADEERNTKEYIESVDIFIAKMTAFLSDIASLKHAKETLLPDDMVYVQSLMHSIVSDLHETYITSHQAKTLSFIQVLCKALLFS